MTPRHILLAVGAVLVLGMGVYLVLEVSRPPVAAQASGPGATSVRRPSPPDRPSVTEPTDRGSAMVRAPIPPSSSDRPAVEDRPNVTDSPMPGVEVEPGAATVMKANPKLDAIMSEANKAYDRGDFDDAKALALKVLAKTPNNVRMLRILVSSDCILGDNAEAQKHYQLLPPGDRAQMRTRCERYGVTFPPE